LIPAAYLKDVKLMTMKKLNIITLVLTSQIMCTAHALDLLADYQKATSYDPTFQTALAELKANQATAAQSYTSYTPTGSFSNSRLQTDTSSRTTFSVSQPLINYQALAVFRQAEPRKGFAEATFVLRQARLGYPFAQGR
jgi:hypothetical protein